MYTRKYHLGDEGDSNLSLFNCNELYRLDDSVSSVIENNDVLAFIFFDYDESNQEIFIYAFETLKKGIGIGTKIIADLQAEEHVNRIYIHPLNSSTSFWCKLGFSPCQGDEWRWEKL